MSAQKPPCRVAYEKWSRVLARSTRQALDTVRVEVDVETESATIWCLAVDGTLYRPFHREDLVDQVDFISQDPDRNGALWLSEMAGYDRLWTHPSVWTPWRGARPRALPGVKRPPKRRT